MRDYKRSKPKGKCIGIFGFHYKIFQNLMRKENIMKQIKKSSLYFIGLTLLLFCGITVAKAQNPQQIAKKALASTVLLLMEDTNGQPLTLGSGFFVRNNQVATNLHVVKGASRGYAKLVGQKTKYDIEGITAVDAEHDLVILKISVPGAIPSPIIRGLVFVAFDE